jgi:P-type conjugative transfer protein TrbJ
MKPFLLSAALAAALVPASLVVAPVQATAAGMPVFDATNYSQNLLQAARALEQINHQLESLQNQATMLQNMAKNLERIDFPELQQMKSALGQIDQLMSRAQSIDFKVDTLDQQFRTMFPGSIDEALKTDQRVAGAKARLDSAMDAFRQSMGVQAQVVSNIQQDSKLLDDLVGRSQGTEGALQAQQSTNQLLALSAKQQLQLQDLIAAAFHSEAIERARGAQSEIEGRAATTRFLGSGKAYSSTRD